jgi:hypothetical protein
MKQSAVSKLSDPVPFKPIPGDDLEVMLVPAAAAEAEGLIFAGQRDQVVARICSRSFVAFTGYVDDEGLPVKNTHAARVELFNIVPVGAAIVSKLRELNEAVLLGEGGAVSG